MPRGLLSGATPCGPGIWRNFLPHQGKRALLKYIHFSATFPKFPAQHEHGLSLNQRKGCEGDGDVVGVVTPLVRGGAKVLHGDQVVELSVQLEVQEREEKGEDGEGQIEVGTERGELKERRTCTWMT